MKLAMLNPSVFDGMIIGSMVVHPILVTRPIVAKPRGTKLYRPSEAVLDLLDSQPTAFTK